MSLSPAQAQVILTCHMPRLDRTLEVLVEKGYVAPGWPLTLFPAGEAFLKGRMDRLRKMLAQDHPGVPFIETDAALLEILQRDGLNEIYVYRGSQPLVVRDGDGQRPLALLDPMLRWRIEAARTDGLYLRRVSIVGHKGSYGYKLGPRYRRETALSRALVHRSTSEGDPVRAEACG